MMRLFPFLRYNTLQNEDYSDASMRDADVPAGAPLRKAHIAPALVQVASQSVAHLEECVSKRERHLSCDERYTPFFSTAGGSSRNGRRGGAEKPRPASVVLMAMPPRGHGNRRKAAAAPMDWGRNGSFMTKPSSGWLHSDEQLTEGGVCYGVRYVGCLEVKTSMKSLDFETRTQVAKESITRVCEAARLKTPDKKRKTDKRICKMLGDRPNMQHAGSNINFTVSTDNLSLVIMESGEIIATHQMQGISFASGGDPETLDFVAYVAKDATGRACYVLECGGGLAQDVITTIGQAFELRFKEYLKKAPKPASLVSRAEELLPERPAAWGDDPEYYNDLPGKQPPPLPPLPRSLSQPTRHDDDAAACNHLFTTQVSEAAIPPSRHGAADAFSGAPYTRRACDKQPVLPPEGVPPQPPSRDDSNGCIPLEQEHWFHSTLTRREAEQLVKRDGDFLVRESSQSPGQYVLTGMQGSHVKHLLLVDPEGVVRTKDRVFESVGHLIEYHRQNGLPITSAESSIVLLSPV